MVKYKLFLPCGRRNVALVFKEGTYILEKRVDIIWAKIIELLVREFSAGKFLDGSMGKNQVEGGALMLNIIDIATERSGGVCLFALEKEPEVERSYKKKICEICLR